MPDPAPGVEQPPRQLKSFARVRLAPGAARRVRFRLDRRAFAYWSGRWRVAPGCYRLEIGASSRDISIRRAILRPGPERLRRHCP